MLLGVSPFAFLFGCKETCETYRRRAMLTIPCCCVFQVGYALRLLYRLPTLRVSPRGWSLNLCPESVLSNRFLRFILMIRGEVVSSSTVLGAKVCHISTTCSSMQHLYCLGILEDNSFSQGAGKDVRDGSFVLFEYMWMFLSPELIILLRVLPPIYATFFVISRT